MNSKAIPRVRRKGTQDSIEKPVPEDVYPVIDTDLARDNLENDIPSIDLDGV